MDVWFLRWLIPAAKHANVNFLLFNRFRTLCTLFGASVFDNPFTIISFRTLCQKQGGGYTHSPPKKVQSLVFSRAYEAYASGSGVRGEEADGQVAGGAQAGGGVQDYGDGVHHDRGGGDVAMGAAGNGQADVRVAGERNSVR